MEEQGLDFKSINPDSAVHYKLHKLKAVLLVYFDG